MDLKRELLIINFERSMGMDYELYGALDSAAAMPQMSTGQMIASCVCGIIACIIAIVAMWKIFTKAGEAGWKSIVPFLNLYTLVKIADGKGIKFLLFCIPIVNVIFGFMLYIRLAKAFGKSTGFGIGLIFLNFIFMLILAFGDAQYVGPRGIPAGAAPQEPFVPQA